MINLTFPCFQLTSHILSHSLQWVYIYTTSQLVSKISTGNYIFILPFLEFFCKFLLLLLPFILHWLDKLFQHLILLPEAGDLLVQKCCFSIFGEVLPLEGLHVLFQ